MKYFIILISLLSFFPSGLISISSFLILHSQESDGLQIYPMENPHEITLSEDQKVEGKTKIIFTQDPNFYFYILNTSPLPGNTKDDFIYEVTPQSFILSTKVIAKNNYEAIVNFIKPVETNSLKKVLIEKHLEDNSFTITVKISKNPSDITLEGDSAIKTHYKPVYMKKKPVTDLGKDTYGMKNLIDSMNNNGEGEVAKSVVGLMNTFENSLSNQNLQEKFNQTLFSADSAAQNASEKFNQKLQDILGPLNKVVDSDDITKDINTMNKEEFALNAGKAMEDIDNGNTESLQNILGNINTEQIAEKGKKSSKKQMKDDATKNKTKQFSKDNSIKDPDQMSQNSKKDNEESQNKKEIGKAEKQKQSIKDLVLQDLKISELFF